MWRGRSTRLALGAVAVAALVALSACGSSSDTPEPSAAESNGVQDLAADEILVAVQDAVDAATSVRAVGSGIQSGSTIEINLQLGADGDTKGSLTNNGQVIQIVATNGTVYFSADEAFWTAQVGAAAAAQLADKYVQVPEGDASFGNIADYATFIGQLVKPEGGVTKGDETTVDGVPVIGLIDDKNDGVLYVSLEGEPLPLKVVPAEGGELVLSDWNADFTVEAPAPEDIVDPSTIVPPQ